MTSLNSAEAPLYRKDIAATQELACIMVSYYSGNVLFTAIESVLSQSQPPKELVVIDNGNPPSTQKRLDALAARTPELSVKRGQGNVGFARGCNLGELATRANSNAGHLLFLNPDCVLPEDGLLRLWHEYSRLPPRSLLSPLLLNADFTEQRGSRRAVLTPWRAAVEWLGLYRLAPSHPYFSKFNRTGEPLPLETHKVDVTSGAAMMLARSLFHELKRFDEGYFLHVEDIDLCVTLLKRGGSSYLAPSIRVIHQGASSTSSPLVVEWHKARGFCRYFRKHFNGVYPPGFLSIVNALVWLRLGLRSPLIVLQPLFRKDSVRENRAADQHSAAVDKIAPTDPGD